MPCPRDVTGGTEIDASPRLSTASISSELKCYCACVQHIFSPHGIRLLLLLIICIGAALPADGSEQTVTGVNATASMYDNRTSSDADENKGCYDTGCLPRYTLDGLLNDEAESRWSCSEDIDETIGKCFITYDLHESYTLSKLRIYFHKSDDDERDTNPFSVSTSANNLTYEFSFEDVNFPGTDLGTGENFSFPDWSSGRYVRLTAILDEGQWLSINEVEIYVEVETPSPVAVVTHFPTPVDVTVRPSSTPTASPTSSPTNSLDHTASPSASPIVPTLSPAPTPTPTNIPTPNVVPTAPPITPTPTVTSDDSSVTPAPTGTPLPISTPTITPSAPPITPIPTVTTAAPVVMTDDDSDGDTVNTLAIIGGVAGAAVLLTVIGFLASKRLTTPPPPLYEDVVGAAGS